MCLHIFIYAMSNHMLINRMRSKHKFPIVSQFSMYRTSDYICLCAVVIRLKAIKELSNSLSTHIGLIYIYSKPDRWVCSLSTWLCVKFTAQACDRAREREKKKRQQQQLLSAIEVFSNLIIMCASIKLPFSSSSSSRFIQCFGHCIYVRERSRCFKHIWRLTSVCNFQFTFN